MKGHDPTSSYKPLSQIGWTTRMIWKRLRPISFTRLTLNFEHKQHGETNVANFKRWPTYSCRWRKDDEPSFAFWNLISHKATWRLWAPSIFSIQSKKASLDDWEPKLKDSRDLVWRNSECALKGEDLHSVSLQQDWRGLGSRASCLTLSSRLRWADCLMNGLFESAFISVWRTFALLWNSLVLHWAVQGEPRGKESWSSSRPTTCESTAAVAIK